MPIKVVAETFGHSRPSITIDTYVHALPCQNAWRPTRWTRSSGPTEPNVRHGASLAPLLLSAKKRDGRSDVRPPGATTLGNLRPAKAVCRGCRTIRPVLITLSHEWSEIGGMADRRGSQGNHGDVGTGSQRRSPPRRLDTDPMKRPVTDVRRFYQRPWLSTYVRRVPSTGARQRPLEIQNSRLAALWLQTSLRRDVSALRKPATPGSTVLSEQMDRHPRFPQATTTSTLARREIPIYPKSSTEVRRLGCALAAGLCVAVRVSRGSWRIRFVAPTSPGIDMAAHLRQ